MVCAVTICNKTQVLRLVVVSDTASLIGDETRVVSAGGVKLAEKNLTTVREKPIPMTRCPPQIPHGLANDPSTK
jgi:hypothetical protein